MIRSSIGLVTIFLLGCSTGVREGSPYLHRSLAPGDRLVVNETITVPHGARTVYFQGGAPQPARGLSIWYPSCRLVLADASDTDRTITGGVWRISGFQLFEQDTSFDTLTTSTVVNLVAEDSPAVESLICERSYGMNDYQNTPTYITRDEFERALGVYVSSSG